jgi:hypothetical protein
MPLNEVV